MKKNEKMKKKGLLTQLRGYGTENLNKLLGGPKTHADIWSQQQRYENNWKLAMNAQGKKAFVTRRHDYSEAVRAIKDSRQKRKQESNYPILPRRLVNDHIKKGNGNGAPGPRHLRLRLHGQGRKAGGPVKCGKDCQ